MRRPNPERIYRTGRAAMSGRLVDHERPDAVLGMTGSVRMVWLVLTGIGLVAVPYLVMMGPAFGFDAHAYWSLNLAHPYSGAVALEIPDAFLYSPPVALLMAPFHLLPWPVFLAAWTTLLYVAVGWLGRWRWGLALVAFAPIAMEIHYGNINLLLAVAIAASFRWPALWTIVVLTKPSAAVGLLFPLVQRQWRPFLIVLGLTAFVCAVSAMMRPDLWSGYIGLLIQRASVPLLVPLAWRLPIAAALIVWGARTDHRWTVPVGAAIALPQSWWTSLALLAAVPRSLDTPMLPSRGLPTARPVRPLEDRQRAAR